MHERLLAVDYDATITEDDVLDRVALTFADEHIVTEEAGALDHTPMTLHEVLRQEYAAVRAARAEVVAWVVENARVRGGFHELVDLAREHDWPLVVLSSGFHTLIDPVLEREGLGDLEVIANEVVPDPSGWRVVFRDESVCEACGEACKRRSLNELSPAAEIVYVGDGYSDRCAALRADLVFARAGLARYLRQLGVAFEPFESFHQIVDYLRTHEGRRPSPE